MNTTGRRPRVEKGLELGRERRGAVVEHEPGRLHPRRPIRLRLGHHPREESEVQMRRILALDQRVAARRQPVPRTQVGQRPGPLRGLAPHQRHQPPAQPWPLAHQAHGAGKRRQHGKVPVREERQRGEDGANPRQSTGSRHRGRTERERVAHQHVGAGREPRGFFVGLLERGKHELLHHNLAAAAGVHHPLQRSLVPEIDVGTERLELQPFLLHGRPIGGRRRHDGPVTAGAQCAGQSDVRVHIAVRTEARDDDAARHGRKMLSPRTNRGDSTTIGW